MKQVAHPRPRLTVARLMRWIASVAVSLAVLRPGVPAFLVLLAPLCWAALAYSVASVLFPRLFVERPLYAVLIDARPVRYPVGLWAMSGGQPIRVELVACGQEEAPADAPEVGERYLDGRDYLCVSTAEDAERLDIGGPGVHIIRHPIFGPCRVRPATGRDA